MYRPAEQVTVSGPNGARYVPCACAVCSAVRAYVYEYPYAVSAARADEWARGAGVRVVVITTI